MPSPEISLISVRGSVRLGYLSKLILLPGDRKISFRARPSIDCSFSVLGSHVSGT